MIFFNKDLYEKRSRRVRLNEALMRSIDEGFQGFRIVLQPVIDAKTGRLHSAEVLLRWCNEEFPKAGPMDFVPILEETHKIIPVGRWIIDQALSCVAKWNRMHGASKLPHININFSYIQLIDPALKDYVIGKLEKNKPVLRFISKNLSWGVFRQAVTKSEEDAELSSMEYFQQLIQADPTLRLRAPETMLFLIAELASSACYSTILENEPVSFEELKPDLYNAIRAIIRAHTLPAAQNDI